MARNANGDGGIFKRTMPDGSTRYEGRFSYRDGDGKLKRHTSYAATRRECTAKMKKARERVEAGSPVRDSRIPVSAWLAHWRATTLAVSDRKPATRALYDSLSRLHLEPEPFGAIALNKLAPSDIEALVLSMRAQMKPGKPADDGTEAPPVRAMSDSTIRSVYTTLRSALDAAVRDGLIARNVAALVKRPGVERREVDYLAPVDVGAVLKAARESRYYSALALVALTGLRRGEVTALTWKQVDLEARVLRVTATMGRVGGELVMSEPKTARSRRTVPLSGQAVAILTQHRATQDAERAAYGNWPASDLVFTTAAGTAVDPRNLLRVAEVAAKRAGVEGRVGVHTFRHSAAVAWLESGAHIKSVADLLGHSSIAVTGDVYGHTSDEAARSAVDALDSAFHVDV